MTVNKIIEGHTLKELESVEFREGSNGIPSMLQFTIKNGPARSGYSVYCSMEVAKAIADKITLPVKGLKEKKYRGEKITNKRMESEKLGLLEA